MSNEFEILVARDAGADFVVFGPVFPTRSKKEYGPPLGVSKLSEVAHELAPFRVLAIGGISNDNAGECLRAGASGVAAITLFSKPEALKANAEMVRKLLQE